MPSHPILVLAVAALLAVSGCLGGSAAPPSPTETRSVTTPATPTATAATATANTARPCSLATPNATGPAVEPPANLSATTAERVAETVESRYQSARVEEHSYFNHRVDAAARPEAVEGGYRVVLDGELDYDDRGNENGTVVHVHRPYTVVYLVTGREVVRRGEAGTTGTVVCWSSGR